MRDSWICRCWVVCLALFVFVGCSPRLLPPAAVKDSNRVEIRERLVRDTVYVDIPKEKEVVVTRDSVSHLENDFSTSDAAIIDGCLHHSLETKLRQLEVPVAIPVRDTVIVTEHSETIIKKENYLTKWQSFSMVLGWTLGSLLVIIMAAYILIPHRHV